MNHPLQENSISYHIGCSGFSERLWKGFFYPEDLPTKEFLSYYASRLSSVEINSTFYRKPLMKTLLNWHEQTPPEFRFFIKIPKTITHIHKLSDVQQEVKSFCDHIQLGLQEKLAGFLYQLPPSFHFTDENLSKVLNTVAKGYLNVVEFRHASWWDQEVLSALGAADIVFSGVSYPGNIPSQVMDSGASVLYYRLHGVPVMFKSEYSEEELVTLAQNIRKHEKPAFVFFNNTYGTAGIKNALEMQRILTLSALKI